MSQRYSTAIVLGASISGLLTARALSQYFKQIVVVDKDRLPVGEGMRKGAAQAAHAHGLLASGYRIMDQYFPGMMDWVNEKKGGNRKKGVVSDKKERRGTTPNAIRVYRERAAKRSAVSLS